jgi:hypothetical protein
VHVAARLRAELVESERRGVTRPGAAPSPNTTSSPSPSRRERATESSAAKLFRRRATGRRR